MIILGTNSIKDTGFNVANSCRFNDDSADHLDKTFGQVGNRRTFTISFWAKLTGNNTPSQSAMFGAIFDAALNGSNSDDLYFHTHRLNFSGYYGSTQFALRTTAKYRDPSAWYHFVVAFDTTQSTASNRIKIYANGVQETTFDDETYPSQNFQTSYINTARLHNIGTLVDNDGFPLDGYLAEFCFIDGQALAPDQFGEFDSASGIWKPIDVSGLTFGTNGFYHEFKQAGTSQNSSGLGADTSGNDNHFAVANLTAVDQSTDTCTNNFATLNPLIEFYPSYTTTFSEGNLDATRSDNGGGLATIMPTQGKWYAEFKFITVGNGANAIGVLPYDKITDNEFNVENKGVAYLSSGQKKVDGSASDYGNTYGANDIISIAINLDDGEAVFYKNGTAQNSGNAISGFTNDGAMAISCKGGGSTWKWSSNFGSPPYAISSGNSDGNGYGNFEYAVPSGYFSLCTKNLAEYG